MTGRASRDNAHLIFRIPAAAAVCFAKNLDERCDFKNSYRLHSYDQYQTRLLIVHYFQFAEDKSKRE
jgi:hypothetical protein